jgi:polysaccharide biosynthesis transport protein
VLVTGSAITLAFLQTPRYSSTASVLVQSPPGSGSTGPNMATEKNLARSTAVAQVVIDKSGLTSSPEDLLNGLSVVVPVDTDILQFNYLSSSPAVAQQRAQAFADAYISFRDQQLHDQLLATQTSFQSGIDALEAQLQSVEKAAANTTNPREQAVLSAEAASYIAQIGILQQNLAQVTAQGSASAGRVVEPAALPTSPAKPNKPLDATLGLIAGILLGMGAALLLDRARG